MMGGQSGRLVLVVGPSGVGKDSVIDGARAALAGRDDVVFPHRVITRAAGLGGEDYVAVSPQAFAAMRARGDFALSWAEHDLHYGIPATIDADLASAQQVVINASPAVIDAARAKNTVLRGGQIGSGSWEARVGPYG